MINEFDCQVYKINFSRHMHNFPYIWEIILRILSFLIENKNEIVGAGEIARQ